MIDLSRCVLWLYYSYTTTASDLNEERRHAFGRVVVARDGVDHADGVDEAADALRHADRLTAVQRLTELLQCVQVLHVVLSFVGRIRQLVVLEIPHLRHTTPLCNAQRLLGEGHSTECITHASHSIPSICFCTL